MINFRELYKKEWFKGVFFVTIGITIGVIFYPKKHIEEKLRVEIHKEYSLRETELREQNKKIVNDFASKIEAIESSFLSYQVDTQKKINILVSENTKLKQTSSRKRLKIVKPDGTIIEKEIEESSSESSREIIAQVQEEFNQKIKSIEDRWKRIHEERVTKITEENNSRISKIKEETAAEILAIKKEHMEEVNRSRLRPEIGITTDRDLYFHSTYSLWGPVFIGGGVSGTNKTFNQARIGLGLEF